MMMGYGGLDGAFYGIYFGILGWYIEHYRDA
jgi:hypothetical protein